jgi:hypothetical protein
MSCPLWYLRSDSNIVEDPEAIALQDLFITFQDWKNQTQETNNNSLIVTCFNCNSEAIFSTSTTGSYPLCNNCRD